MYGFDQNNSTGAVSDCRDVQGSGMMLLDKVSTYAKRHQATGIARCGVLSLVVGGQRLQGGGREGGMRVRILDLNSDSDLDLGLGLDLELNC